MRLLQVTIGVADIININKLLLYTIMDCTHLTEYHISYDKHMIVHKTRLYTGLVTYARLHILTSVVVYSCISCLLSADLFMLLLFSNLLFSDLDLLLYCTHCLYAQALSPFLMHSLGHF